MDRTRRLGLTRRGRGILASGIGLLVAALLTGSPALEAAALFAILLVLLALSFALGRRQRAQVHREPPPGTAVVGSPVALRLEVQAPGGTVLVSGLAPAGADDATDQCGQLRLPGRAGPQIFTAAPASRGEVQWPATVVELPDPFGIAHGLVRRGGGERTLVMPRVEHLQHLPIAALTESGEETGGTIAVGRWTLADPAGSPIPREYRSGDDLRRVHWPATARSADPMVRAEDAELGHRAALLLDTDPRHYAHPEAYERAIVAIASVAAFLLSRGWAVSCRSTSGRAITPREWVSDSAGVTEVMTCLALLGPGPSPSAASPVPRGALDAAVWAAGSRDWLDQTPPGFAGAGRLVVLTDPGAGPIGGAVRYDGSRSLQAALSAASGRAMTGIGG